MMPHWLSVSFLLGFGAGLLGIVYRGYVVGELPVRGYNPSREENPLGFSVFLMLYLCAGLGLSGWGLLAMFSMAPDLKWR